MAQTNMTAVEWYAKEHHKLLIQLENKELSLGAYVVKHSDILKQAKQMEAEQKKLLTEIMEADQKSGLYEDHIGDTNKMVTAVEWFIDAITESGHLWMTDKPNDMLELAKFIEQAKQMEKRQIVKAYNAYYSEKTFIDGDYLKGEEYYNQTYGK